MIGKLQKLSQVLAKSASSTASYNASLPLLIRVVSKLKGDLYLLQVGTQTIQTKSHKELMVGERYWGEMGKSSLGHIVLRNLIHQPKIIEYFHHSPLQFSLQDLENLGKEKDIFEGFKDFLAHRLGEAQSKEEFLFLSNMLLALKNGVLNLVIGEKEDILQIKRIGQNKVRFSAIMPLLGIIEGEICLGGSNVGKILELKVMYESTKIALEKHLDLLQGFGVTQIVVDSRITPLYEFKQSLLDVVG